MPQLTTNLTIDAPAGQVWQVIGPGFARIGDWATTIAASAAIPAPAPAAGIPATASALAMAAHAAPGCASCPT
jgi:hypothetical protein